MANISMVVLLRSTDTATTQQFLALKYSYNNGTDVSSQFLKGDKYSFLLFIFLLAVPPIPLSSLLILLFLVYKNCLEMALQVCKTLHKWFLDLSLVPHPLMSYFIYSPALCLSMQVQLIHLNEVCSSLIQSSRVHLVFNTYLYFFLNSSNHFFFFSLLFLQCVQCDSS